MVLASTCHHNYTNHCYFFSLFHFRFPLFNFSCLCLANPLSLCSALDQKAGETTVVSLSLVLSLVFAPMCFSSCLEPALGSRVGFVLLVGILHCATGRSKSLFSFAVVARQDGRRVRVWAPGKE